MPERTIAFSPPDITEEEIAAVADTLRSGWITTGPKTKQFEREIAAYCKTPKAVCLNSATACLEMALRVCGIGPGDEVITTAYTYTASASVVCHVGAKLVLADTAPDSYEMDYDQVERLINEHTKAIIPVDIAGIMCDYDKLLGIVQKKKSCFRPYGPIQEVIGRVLIIADSAHGFGAARNQRRSGQYADFTSFSFHAVKNLTTAEGGALVWKDAPGMDHEGIYRRLMLLTLHGQSKDALEKSKAGSWEYDVVTPGYKCNMTDIMAAIGLVQLKRYPELLKKRRQLIEQYNSLLAGQDIITPAHYRDGCESSGHLYMIRLKGRTRSFCNEVIRRMGEQGVAANVHYKPLPMLTAYKNMGFQRENYPNACRLFENEITLPLHTKLTNEDIAYVAEALLNAVKSCDGRAKL